MVSETRAPDPAPIKFTGKATDYFGIWLSNTVLSILTIGIYTAWAKVKRNRYFLGNTIILGDRIEYHATGLMLFKGRLIVAAVIAVYAGISFISPTAQAIMAIAALPFFPWVINRALKFNARMTSWRNVRFDWHGQYWGVAKVYFLWPIISVLTLGALAPMAARARREYLANNYGLGRERFGAKTPLKPYYMALLWTILFGVVLSAVFAGVIAALFPYWSDELSASLDASSEFPVWLLMIVAPFLAIGPAVIYFQILSRNIIVSALNLGEVAAFHSNIHPLWYLWILLSNFFATIFSALLMYPWAQIRAYRYQTEKITVHPMIEIGTFLDIGARSGQAFGEEFGDMQDIGLEF